MQTTVITIAADQITDWDSFHSVFQATLGFPEFYGRNMDAWIDCMTYVDDPSGGLTRVSIRRGSCWRSESTTRRNSNAVVPNNIGL
jgi:hypothetical protein